MSRLKTQNRTLNNASKHITTIILRVLVLSVIIFLVWSQNHLIVSRNYIYSDNDLPKSFVGYKILHISDICNTLYPTSDFCKSCVSNTYFLVTI